MEKVKVFLGGTCASSTWREELQEKLDSDRIEIFNPIVPDWTPECQAIEYFLLFLYPLNFFRKTIIL